MQSGNISPNDRKLHSSVYEVLNEILKHNPNLGKPAVEFFTPPITRITTLILRILLHNLRVAISQLLLVYIFLIRAM